MDQGKFNMWKAFASDLETTVWSIWTRINLYLLKPMSLGQEMSSLNNRTGISEKLFLRWIASAFCESGQQELYPRIDLDSGVTELGFSEEFSLNFKNELSNVD